MASATVDGRTLASWSAGRSWHRVARTPLPAEEAGRAHLAALLNGPGGPRAKLKTGADDRAETSLKAVYRRLWRLGHAQRSGAYATTQDQLVAALMPVMGWRDCGSVEANRSAHGRSVRRWLDRLQAMGLIRWAGVRDNRGRWWRIELELLTPPAPDAQALRLARRRVRGFARREHRRRQTNAQRRRDLGHVLGRSSRPSPTCRRGAARQRAQAVQAVRATRRAACASACRNLQVRSNPFGALAPLGDDTPDPISSFATDQSNGTVTERTGERVCAHQKRDNHQIDDRDPLRNAFQSSDEWVNTNVSIEENRGRDKPVALWSPEEIAAAKTRIEASERAVADGTALPSRWDALAATRERAWRHLADWPAGRRVPDRVLTAAFEHATGGDCLVRLPRDGSHRVALDRALARYRRYSAQRPVDRDGSRWPESPGAALAWAMRNLGDHHARDGERPASPVYAIGRLNLIAKQMAAAAKRADRPGELAARQRRRERLEQRQASHPIVFRTAARSPRWGGSTETHRRAAIDAALAGELPGFDALHGFIVRASDLLGEPNPHRHTAYGDDAHQEALSALRYLPTPTRPSRGGR